MNKISQIREDFSYAMEHDMKTPLSTIMMVQDMLKSGRLEGKPEIKNKYMNIAQSETEHLFALTNKILTISKLESNHTIFRLDTHLNLTYLCAVTFNNNDYGKRKSKLPGGI